jgi:dihydroorotate dehydrogenase (fumarate)
MNMDLKTQYLGLSLPHPFVVGASPLGDSLDRLRRAEDAGAAAIVLRSLFEEQQSQDALAHYLAAQLHADAHGEATSYLPPVEPQVFGPDEYYEHVRAAKAAVRVPLVASLNGCSTAGWLEHARAIDAAGADALELNLYEVATEASDSGEEIERRSAALVREVVRAVRLPVCVKLSPFYTSLPNFALQLQAAGARGLVLFNRFYEPDIDPETLSVTPHLELSTSTELLLRLRWLAILSPQFAGSLACSGGVHTVRDAQKALLAGAHVLQLVGALLRGGLGRIAVLREELQRVLVEAGYSSLQQLRGSMDYSRTPDPKAFERGNYQRLLQTWVLPE